MEDEKTHMDIFKNFVEILFIYEGEPFRQLPIICRYIEELWSTFLVHYNSKNLDHNLIALLNYGMNKHKVSNTVNIRISNT